MRALGNVRSSVRVLGFVALGALALGCGSDADDGSSVAASANELRGERGNTPQPQPGRSRDLGGAGLPGAGSHPGRPADRGGEALGDHGGPGGRVHGGERGGAPGRAHAGGPAVDHGLPGLGHGGALGGVPGFEHGAPGRGRVGERGPSGAGPGVERGGGRGGWVERHGGRIHGHPGWREGGYRGLPRRHGLTRGYYGYRNAPIVIGGVTIAPAYWGFTGGSPWYGLGEGAVAQPLPVPEIVGVIVAVDRYELALAESVAGRVDPCSEPFVEDVIQAHRELSSEVEGYASQSEPSEVLDQIRQSAGDAVEQFAPLSGAELGRAYVFQERTRAEQMLDLIDNRMAGTLDDPTIGAALERLREMYAERIDAADEVAQSCGYPPVDLEGH